MSVAPHILTTLPRFTVLPTAAELDGRVADILALADPADIEHGLDWYDGHAGEAIRELATHYAVPGRTIAGMLAAMSAGYSWPMSLAHIGVLMEGSREGIAAPYGWRSIAQAEAIRDGADPDVVLRNTAGRTETVKRWNFFHNLMGDLTRVTIDVHMARGLTGGVIEATPSSARTYTLLADAVRRAADDFDCPPAAMQAILWTIIRGAAH